MKFSYFFLDIFQLYLPFPLVDSVALTDGKLIYFLDQFFTERSKLLLLIYQVYTFFWRRFSFLCERFWILANVVSK